jgi:hypothetical protein
MTMSPNRPAPTDVVFFDTMRLWCFAVTSPLWALGLALGMSSLLAGAPLRPTLLGGGLLLGLSILLGAMTAQAFAATTRRWRMTPPD